MAVLTAIAFYLGFDVAGTGDPGAAIGVGFSSLPVLLLGLPWATVLFFWAPPATPASPSQ